MKKSYIVKRMLLYSSLLLLFSGVGLSANASHRHTHYENKWSTTVKQNKSNKHKLSNQFYYYEHTNLTTHKNLNSRKVENTIRVDEMKDINHIRRQHHLKPLKENHRLDKLASLRAKHVTYLYRNEPKKFCHQQEEGNEQNSDDWIHGYDNHETILNDASRLHIHLPNYSENASPLYTGHLYRQQDWLGDGKESANITTAHQLAKQNIYDLINRDLYAHNDHRKALLNKKNPKIGLGVYYNAHLGNSTNGDIKGGMIQDFNQSY